MEQSELVGMLSQAEAAKDRANTSAQDAARFATANEFRSAVGMAAAAAHFFYGMAKEAYEAGDDAKLVASVAGASRAADTVQGIAKHDIWHFEEHGTWDDAEQQFVHTTFQGWRVVEADVYSEVWYSPLGRWAGLPGCASAAMAEFEHDGGKYPFQYYFGGVGMFETDSGYA